MKYIWLVWALNLLAQNFMFTIVSRARNSGSLKRHVVAAIGSNGVWMLQFQILVGPMMDYLNGGHGWLLQIAVGAFYTVFTVAGSVIAHYWALRTEKGKGAVGASAKYAQITRDEWNAVKAATESRVIAEELIDFVIAKYGVKSLDGFTCPIHRRLAVSLHKFEAKNAA